MMRRLIQFVVTAGLLALPLSANAGSITVEFAGTAGCTAGSLTCTVAPGTTGIVVNLLFTMDSAGGSDTGTVGYGTSMEWDRPADVGGTPLLDATGFTKITPHPPLTAANPGNLSVFSDSTAVLQGKAYTFENVGFSSLNSSGTITVGTVTFDSLGVTGTTIFYSGQFNDGVDGTSDKFGIQYTPLFNSATLNIVPEPGTAALLGLGLLGLVAAGRRSRS